MAKQPHPQSKVGTSRIRFIMLDAEIAEGDLSQITSAIQNALKPGAIIQQRIPAQPTAATLIGNGGGDSETRDEDAVESEEQEDAEVEFPKPARAPRAARVRKPKTPDVIDANFDSEVSLADFAKAHLPKAEVDRNLVIAAWFKEYRDTPAVTSAHIYTGYRKLDWPVGFEDFSWPLRRLKKDKLMTSSNRGEYVINHLGLDRVRKLGIVNE